MTESWEKSRTQEPGSLIPRNRQEESPKEKISRWSLISISMCVERGVWSSSTYVSEYGEPLNYETSVNPSNHPLCCSLNLKPKKGLWRTELVIRFHYKFNFQPRYRGGLSSRGNQLRQLTCSQLLHTEPFCAICFIAPVQVNHPPSLWIQLYDFDYIIRMTFEIQDSSIFDNSLKLAMAAVNIEGAGSMRTGVFLHMLHTG